jgi:hypothetical protein
MAIIEIRPFDLSAVFIKIKLSIDFLRHQGPAFAPSFGAINLSSSLFACIKLGRVDVRAPKSRLQRQILERDAIFPFTVHPLDAPLTLTKVFVRLAINRTSVSGPCSFLCLLLTQKKTGSADARIFAALAIFQRCRISRARDTVS